MDSKRVGNISEHYSMVETPAIALCSIHRIERLVITQGNILWIEILTITQGSIL